MISARLELWLRFAVSVALLALVLVLREDTPGLSGVVVGLVAGYWLPAPRSARTVNGQEVHANGRPERPLQ